jgi:hypothetical protein
MSAFALHCRIKGIPYDDEAEILKRIEAELRNSFFWGENAGPLCFAALLLLWIHGQEELACQWAGHMTKAIAKLSNAHDGMGMPDPYIEADMVLRAQHLGEEAFGPRQTFRGRSFFLRVLVEFLARRRRKRMLKNLWYDVSEVDHVEFTLDSKKDLYRWRARTGSLDSRRWKHPQEWDELVQMAEAAVPQEVLLTRRYESLLLPFVLVYPHRMTPSLARLIENLVG